MNYFEHFIDYVAILCVSVCSGLAGTIHRNRTARRKTWKHWVTLAIADGFLAVMAGYTSYWLYVWKYGQPEVFTNALLVVSLSSFAGGHTINILTNLYYAALGGAKNDKR